MIRIISVASLTLMLIFVLYIPSARPPDRFIEQIRTEHALNTAHWGNERALLILERGLSLNGTLNSVSPVPNSSQAPKVSQVNEAVGHEMGKVMNRFFGNTYFRSIDALLALACFRCASLLAWLPVEIFVLLALLADGFFVRIRRSKEFKKHDPEWFALHACALVLLLCGTVVMFVTPVTVLPLVLAALAPVGGLFLSRMVANFHRRG
ncbi:MAG: DUF4400 domain-containing protein [Betaproteobacteria bacterium]|nr:DUF4400 domain-containing protein [Betaproteobacteria bacterium]